MSPAIAKLEALLSRVQQNRTKPRSLPTPALRAQPLALDEPLHLPPADAVATDLASALGAATPAPSAERAPAPTRRSSASYPAVTRPVAPVEDEEPEITLGASAAQDDDDDDDAMDTGERVAVEAPAPYAEPPAAAAAAVHIAPTPAAPQRTSAQPAARAPGPPPLRATASPPVEARSATPARAPAAPPVSEEVPTTTRDAPASRRAVEVAPLPASAAVARTTGAAAVVPRSFGALVARALALRPKR